MRRSPISRPNCESGLCSSELEDKILEAARLEERTNYDIETLREVGYCSGVENYSRHLARRQAGSTPWTLLDYFPDDFLMFIDESHISIPQVRGMYFGDISRKQTLVDFGFRLPSALDNRPLNFEEFDRHINQVIFVSATPGPYETQHSQQIVEQLIRPTGLLDPTIEVKPTKGQIDDLLDEIRARVDRGERVLVTTLTKKMAEDLADYLQEMGIKTHYLHSEINTLDRVEILRDLRLGVYDVIVGINLLREGLDLPEVSLIGILDADKEGYLRSERLACADHRPSGAAYRRTCHYVCRCHDRLDAAALSTKPIAVERRSLPITKSTELRRRVFARRSRTSTTTSARSPRRRPTTASAGHPA